MKKYILSKALRGPVEPRELFIRRWTRPVSESTPVAWDRVFLDEDTNLFLSRMDPEDGKASECCRIMIYSHGNFQDVSDKEVKSLCRKMSDSLGCYVYSYEYPGYVDSTEARTRNEAESMMLYASRVAVEKVKRLHSDHPKVEFWLCGFSIGSWMAINMAIFMQMSGYGVKHLVLVSAMASCISTRSPCFISDALFKRIDCFDNKDSMQALRCKTTFIHGSKDTIVRPYNSRYLAWKLKMHHPRPSNVEYIEEASRGHNDMVLGAHNQEFLGNLLRRVLLEE